MEPNRLWVCDLKYIQTGQGFLFLAAVQDVYSRRIIGWKTPAEALDEHLRSCQQHRVATTG